MCGILTVFETKPFTKQAQAILKQCFATIRHRGPDQSSSIIVDNHIFLGFHRLAFHDQTDAGMQPFEYFDQGYTYYVLCNGEIYNASVLIQKHRLTPQSQSDCEVIGLLTIKLGFKKMIETIQGEFACVVIKRENNRGNYECFVGRDHLGVRPLFFGLTQTGFALCSEAKGIKHICTEIQQWKPRVRSHYTSVSDIRTEHAYQEYTTIIPNKSYDHNNTLTTIRDILTSAVQKRLSSERPLACLLSGGLDSSLIAAIAAKHTNTPLNTFTIGMEGGTDLPFAQSVAEHIGSNHHVITLTQSDALNAIVETIYAIESYDITSVRASIWQWLLAQYISKHTDFKALLCGELSDELCSGYKYFHQAPSPQAMHSENCKLIQAIHRFDGLRTDRTMAAHGLEVRLPFADEEFVQYYLSIDPSARMPHQGVEKRLLRESFAGCGLLPDSVLRRSKEAFSDGVSGTKQSRFQTLQNAIDTIISDEEFLNESVKYTHNTPFTKESYYYRKIFGEKFGEHNASLIPYFRMPAWCGNIQDPSARVLPVYN